MMASCVMILAIVGMIQVVTSGSEMIDVARKQTIAMQVIHGQIEQIHLNTWAEVTAMGTPRTVNVAGDNTASDYMFVFGVNLPTITNGYRCTRTIANVRTDLKQVTFTVTWTGNTGRLYSRSSSTYVGKNGLYVTYQRS
jgi:hypothetical protein